MSHSNTGIPLNQILYGPPGTGKTYHTIDKALEILLEYGEIESIPKNREEKKKKFDEYKANGQIAFITFHQSFSYEEFVEGIKPIIGNSGEDNNKKDNGVSYEISSGIFKTLCKKALLIYQNSETSSQNDNEIIDKNKEFWRLYTVPENQEDYFDECIKNEHVWAYSGYGGADIEEVVQESDYVIIPDGSKKIRAFGVFKEFYKKESVDLKNDKYKEKIYRKVKWLWQKAERQDSYLLEGINFGIPTFQKIVRHKDEVLKYMNLLVSHKNKPYILIIDEINRGNISKILGELITLIEPSKRIGNDEELKVTLPYSKEFFGVPNNLYIIGTMNTADRSIALLDTALRRRFEFIEMMPQPSLLQDCAGVNLQKLLESINHRIEFLLDREHTIGHAYFIGVKTLEELQAVFAKKIIPLLQEYCYEDYAKIDAVLNGNGMIKVDEEITFSKLFNSKFNDFDNEKSVYQIIDSCEWKLWQFVKIYDEKKAKELEESLKKVSKIEPTIKENDEN